MAEALILQGRCATTLPGGVGAGDSWAPPRWGTHHTAWALSPWGGLWEDTHSCPPQVLPHFSTPTPPRTHGAAPSGALGLCTGLPCPLSKEARPCLQRGPRGQATFRGVGFIEEPACGEGPSTQQGEQGEQGAAAAWGSALAHTDPQAWRPELRVRLLDTLGSTHLASQPSWQGSAHPQSPEPTPPRTGEVLPPPSGPSSQVGSSEQALAAPQPCRRRPQIEPGLLSVWAQWECGSALAHLARGQGQWKEKHQA